ncbi:MAG: DUF1275 domain-containing protein [Rhizobiales bacterium]|nr:DUF1275 domain-containing protein [Hyphomicrobiales bacterium]
MDLHLKRGGGRPHTGYVDVLRHVIGAERDRRADLQLGMALCCVAGAVNAGGFLAVAQYTSHMSGIISAMADNLALGGVALVLAGLGSVLAFVAGAATSAILINWGRRHHGRSQYALPLLLEALLLLCFGLAGGFRQNLPAFVVVAVPLLCFIMGLQNAIITKVSQARIRTTHVTGIVTDIGIELGKLIYWNRSRGEGLDMVRADRDKLRLLSALLAAFFAGGVLGALGFKQIGFFATVPLAALLLLLAGVPLVDDLVTAWRRRG